MDNVINFPDRSRIQEEACIWLVKLDGGELSREDAHRFHDWLDISQEHRDAMIELADLWDRMDVLSDLSDLFPLAKKQVLTTNIFGRIFNVPGLPVATAVAAMLLIIGLVGFNSFHHYPGDAMQMETTYRTSIGEQVNIALPDGSDTKLNTDSLMEVSYGENQRRIRLVKGEAHFEVAHDSSRPFVVYAGTSIVRAVGTAFSVRLRDDEVEVTVTEGRVELASTIGSAPGPVVNPDKRPAGKVLTTISAGQSAEYRGGDSYSVETVKPEIIERKLSWRHGMLIFEGEPLEKVVEEISRYTNTEIVITDPAIRKIRVGGYFRAGQTEALLAVLETNFGINIERKNGDLVFLTGAKIVQATNN